MEVNQMKRIAIGCLVALGLVVGGAGAAHAGEYNGKGEPVPGGVNGKSECSYSGRDIADNLENQPNFPDDAYTIHGVQSYGQFKSQGLADQFGLPNPGVACRGNLGG
jgi:hypothetical protein